MNTVIVTGPQGCGKSLRAAELMRHYGCGQVVDEWDVGDPITAGALHLTNAPLGRVGSRSGAVRVVQWARVPPAPPAAREAARHG